MTEHLPECPDEVCICSYLRACAKRVLDGASEQDYANGKSHGLLDGYEDGYHEGYADALDAAREAVTALPWKVAVSYGPIDCGQQCEHGPCSCSGVMRPEAWMTGPAETIAAIDALTENSND